MIVRLGGAHPGLQITIVASFTPTLTQSFAMASDYYAGSLYLSVDAEIDGALVVLGRQLFRATTTIHSGDFHVGAEADRSLCKCAWS